MTTAVVRPAITNWQETFLELIPDIQNFARYAFRKLPPDHREEAISEIVARTCVAFARLAELGLLEKAYATVLARFAVAQYADGRRTGTTTNTRDLTSPACAKKHAVRVDSLHRFDASKQEWREVVVEDASSGPAEVAAFRIDFEEWLASLPPDKSELVNALSGGETPSEVAAARKLSRGRVSQIRKELAQSWEVLQCDDTN